MKFKNLSSFIVNYLHSSDVLHFIRLNENEWKLNEAILSDDRVQRDYDYFTSHWMDYEVNE